MLLFQLRFPAGTPVAGTALRLMGDDAAIIPVPMDADGRFALPDIPPGRWQLVHNRGRLAVTVRALVFFTGASEANRPLGDLRLQCRVGWELRKSGLWFVARTGFDALGGCGSSRMAFYFLAPRPIAAASLAHRGAAMPLVLRDDRGEYRAPLGDRAFANTDQVTVSFQ